MKLAAHLFPLFKKGESIAELGCGLGYITQELREMGLNIKGYDIEPGVIEAAKKRYNKNCYFVKDCIQDIPTADSMLSVFFGHYTDPRPVLAILSKITNRFVIVSNLHTGHRHKTGSSFPIGSMLAQAGIQYHQKSIVIPFPQPFTSPRDAQNFVKSYYPGHWQMVLKELKVAPGHLILENNKSMIVTVIDKEEI